jgi:hypothetical protein
MVSSRDVGGDGADSSWLVTSASPVGFDPIVPQFTRVHPSIPGRSGWGSATRTGAGVLEMVFGGLAHLPAECTGIDRQST